MSAARRDATPQSDVSLSRFRHPKYWPIWLFWLALHATSKLPLRAQLGLGRLLGRVLHSTMRRERKVAFRNLEVCFPAMPAAEREGLLRRHFEALGISFIEMGIGWFTPIAKLRRLIAIKGREHLEAALRAGGPVLLWGAHFTTLEVGVAILEDLCPHCAILYRPQRNAMLDTIIRRGRARFAERQIPRDDVRRMLKCLKQNYTVVYFPDQTYLGNQSAIIPFFGEPALTNTATTKLATMTGASVLTYFYRRTDAHYELEIGPPIDGVPSRDATADAVRLFAALERFIAGAPEQYLWIYKKFKRRPAPFSDPYATR
jgi:Kdo2-lipid IVA lauroyltransferase/acyltransferase